jgi:CrcB protein
MVRTLLLIAIGGSAGSVCRYLSQQFLQDHYPSSIPIGTLFVNISGCFIVGMVYSLSGKGNIISPELRIFLVTGFCGGFTTYSSFAYENVRMVLDGEFYYASIYILVSVVIGFGAVYAGILFIKLIS